MIVENAFSLGFYAALGGFTAVGLIVVIGLIIKLIWSLS